MGHSQWLFIRLKKVILNARYTAIRVRYDVYTYLRVPILCCAFREFSTQNINRTIDWRDIGQCNLNGHKQKSKVNKHPIFEFILTHLLVYFCISLPQVLITTVTVLQPVAHRDCFSNHRVCDSWPLPVGIIQLWYQLAFDQLLNTEEVVNHDLA